MSSPSFFETELERALSEQAFGIDAYSILRSDCYTAVAAVSLLEGDKILTTLTLQGYSIASNDDSNVFETLEGLLQSVSPVYEKRKREQLMKKARESVLKPLEVIH